MYDIFSQMNVDLEFDPFFKIGNSYDINLHVLQNKQISPVRHDIYHSNAMVYLL